MGSASALKSFAERFGSPEINVANAYQFRTRVAGRVHPPVALAVARQGSNPQPVVIIILAPCWQRMTARRAYTLSLSG